MDEISELKAALAKALARIEALEAVRLDADVRQIVEMPEFKAFVREFHLWKKRCPKCGGFTRGKMPPGSPKGAFGSRIQATTAMLSGRFRLSRREVKAASAVHADETGFGRRGDLRMWLWTATSGLTEVFRLLPGRGGDQAKDLLGEGFSGILHRDRWKPYEHLPGASSATRTFAATSRPCSKARARPPSRGPC